MIAAVLVRCCKHFISNLACIALQTKDLWLLRVWVLSVYIMTCINSKCLYGYSLNADFITNVTGNITAICFSHILAVKYVRSIYYMVNPVLHLCKLPISCWHGACFSSNIKEVLALAITTGWINITHKSLSIDKWSLMDFDLVVFHCFLKYSSHTQWHQTVRNAR